MNEHEWLRIEREAAQRKSELLFRLMREGTENGILGRVTERREGLMSILFPALVLDVLSVSIGGNTLSPLTSVVNRLSREGSEPYIKRIARRVRAERLRKNTDVMIFDIADRMFEKFVGTGRVDVAGASMERTTWRDWFALELARKQLYIEDVDSSVTRDLVDLVMDAVGTVRGVDQSRIDIALLSDLVARNTAKARQLLTLAERRLERYKSEVVLPTLFSPFNRVIGVAARLSGNAVRSFDHGTGSGLWRQPTHAAVEVTLTDRYTTFSYGLKEGMLSNLRMVGSDVDEKRIDVCRPIERGLITQQTGEVKIVYAPTISTNDPNITGILRPAEYLRWQIDLLELLKGLWNGRIELREHPESLGRIPKTVRRDLGVESESNGGNKLWLFDYGHTTLMRDMISSGNAVLYVEVTEGLLHNKAREEMDAASNIRLIRSSDFSTKRQLEERLRGSIDGLVDYLKGGLYERGLQSFF